jgi:hypothetical protein
MDARRQSPGGAEGVSRTYLDFYLGFGFTISIYLLQAVLLCSSRRSPGSSRVTFGH